MAPENQPKQASSNRAMEKGKFPLVAQIFSILDGEPVLDKKLRLGKRAKVKRPAIYRRKPLKFWLAEARPKLIRAIVKWLTIRQAKHGFSS